MCTLWITVQFLLRVFPESPPSVCQSERLPAEVSYINLLGVTSLFWGPRSRELGLGLHVMMSPLAPRLPLRRRRKRRTGDAGQLLEADAHRVSPAARHKLVLVMKQGSPL